MIDENIVDSISNGSVISVPVRSSLTCQASRGICIKCYGRNLANNEPARIGDADGIVAAQSIGEPGTQLTLRTFHIGGTASRIIDESQRFSKLEGQVTLSKTLNLVDSIDNEGQKNKIAQSRNGEIYLKDKSKRQIATWNVPYGAKVFVKDKQKIKVIVSIFGRPTPIELDFIQVEIER